jgi:predicted Fe-Mo cluster-binding NifX family protein
MRIAIPVWENKVSPVLDTARRLLIVEVKEQGEISRSEIFFDEQDIPRRCHRIRGMAVDTLICGAVSRPFLRMLMSENIDIIPEIAGLAEEVLEAYIQGNLFNSRYFMPGCKRHGFLTEDRPLPVKKAHRQRGARKRQEQVNRS